MLRCISACVCTLAFAFLLCGCKNGVLDDGGPLPGFAGDTPPQDGYPPIADGPVVVTIAETDEAIVLHVPLARPDQADDIAGQMASLLTALTVPTWGAGDAGFGVHWIDWRAAVRGWIEESIDNGATGSAKLFAKGIHSVKANLFAVTTELAPATMDDGAGALPIVAVYTGGNDYGLGGGVWVDVRLRSQMANCTTCPFGEPTTIKQTRVVLLSATDVGQLKDSGYWSGGLNWVIAKSAVWWAASQDDKSKVRNWIELETDGGSGFDVRCLTADGVWP